MPRRRPWLILILATACAASAAYADTPQAPGGGAEPDFSDQLPRIAPVEPAKALGTFEVKAPFVIELAAAEPLVHDPVAMAFDEDGRLYVVEMSGYSEQRDERRGAIRLLEDADGDGRFEKSTLFADGFLWATSVACFDGGVFVGDAPDIWYLKDTDGDGKADLRRRVLTGFSHRNVQAMLNTFLWGLDNRIHVAVSRSGAELRPGDDEQAAPLNLRGRDLAFDPRTLAFAPTSGGGQHGMSFDDWGRKFVCSNSDHIQQVMYEDRYLQRNGRLAAPGARLSIAADGPQADVYRISPLEPWRVLRTKLRLEGTLMQFRMEGGGRPAGYFTSATGVTIYRGDNWPAEYHGQALVADVGSNIVHRKRLDPNGLEFIARRIDEKSEFVASRDIWFRPVQFANGPDGCLYVADMYREIIEHPDSFGDVIKKSLDLTVGRDRGRIYRIRAADRPRRDVAQLSRATSDELAALLAHPNAWHHETAARLLYERQDRTAATALRKVAADSDSPLGRMHALYALDGLDLLEADDILHALDDAHPRVREHAVKLAEKFLGSSPAISERLLAMVGDDDLGVRYQLAFTLGELHSPARLHALAKIIKRDAADRWMRLAVLSSLSEGAEEVFNEIVADQTFRRRDAAREVLSSLATLIARSDNAASIAGVVSSLGSLNDDEAALAAAIVRGLSQGLRRGRSLEDLTQAKLSAAGAKRFRRIIADAAQTAANAKAPTALRVDAIELVALKSFADARPVLIGLLDGRQPHEVGEAALQALGRYRNPDTATAVLECWPTLSPRLRAGASELLASRAEYAKLLLDAIEARTLTPGDLNAAQIQRLCLSKDEQLRQRAVRLLSPARPGKRQDVVAAYREALGAAGNAERGRTAFRKTCVACHKAEGVGHELGPNLAAFKHRGAEAILVNVLDPNREVNPQYITYTAVTEDGQAVTGMLTAESASSITLTQAEGKSVTLLRNEIEELRGSGASLMPEGLEKDVDRQTMADLIAYLMSLH